MKKTVYIVAAKLSHICNGVTKKEAKIIQKQIEPVSPLPMKIYKVTIEEVSK